ncbi:fumarylacetoacetase [Powellomyces hirtus]|uniref:Fumarylacetoacetase n=1 Tax=Powellomyces hirtus TaxID=109895 RepID=A0A507DR70_9FUNG|nr:fumarylacetoacetase [Powellomyces hirtus]
MPPVASFVEVLPDSDFPLENIPFGVISTAQQASPRAATAIGTYAVDLLVLAKAGAFEGPQLGNGVAERVFGQPALNEFMSLGRSAWREARSTIQATLSETGPSKLRGNKTLQAEVLKPLNSVQYHMPAQIGDYTDFYASKEHATNVGVMFRGKENALMPNWVHLPVGYHGRASSVVVSGTPITRPSGLILNPQTKAPEFSTSKKLDYELEVAAFVGIGNTLGDSIPVSQADDHIFGLALMNDWSARDIQQYEYVPLGPFLGKNFGTTISPWIITLDALEPFRDPTPASYLNAGTYDAYDVKLEVAIKPPSAEKPTVVSRSNLKYMYWSFKQMLAHHTINGCNMRAGDLLGSGTISGPTPESLGSLLELSKNGSEPFQLTADDTRAFIEDGDEVVMRGYCERDLDGHRIRIGFGEARGKLAPPKPAPM